MGMFGPTFSDYYQKAIEKVRQDILQESDGQILGSDINELANYYYQKYALMPIDFDQDDISFEPQKQIRLVPARMRDHGYQSEGDINWEYESIKLSILIQPNADLATIKDLGGAGRYLDGFDESITFSSNEIFYCFDIKWYGGKMDDDAIANEINSKSDRLIGTLTSKNANINNENASFIQSIKHIIFQRKDKITNDNDRINSLTQKIRIPIKQKASVATRAITIDTKKFVQVVKPTPRLPEEYTLEESILTEIISYIDNQCITFERAPSSYKLLGEEQLRDIILAALNGIFEGNATGETFVKKSRTDIHLKIEKGEILIFECKIWGGEKLYLETIDQLTRYVTWRQNYGVVIMFCKNKDFSKILAQIPGIIQQHTQYVGGYKKPGNAHFVSDHSLPEDNGKKIRVHHLIYNLFSE